MKCPVCKKKMIEFTSIANPDRVMRECIGCGYTEMNEKMENYIDSILEKIKKGDYSDFVDF